MPRARTVVAGLLVLLSPLAPAGAATGQDRAEPVRVAVRVLEPFVIELADGDLQGFSVDLAREIGRLSDLDIEFVLVDSVGDQIDAVVDGEADAAIGAISITSEREELVDFSQPMFESGIQIAAPSDARRTSIGDILGEVFSPALGLLLGLMAVGVLITGIIVWMLERRKNPDFRERGWRGAFSGFWWATVTLFTIGYGDKVPSRAASRVLSMFWMLAGVLIVATLTAEVTASVTIDRIESNIDDISDLQGRDVLTIEGTTSSDFLELAGIAAAYAPDPDSAFDELAAGEADAFVYDAAIIQYLVARREGIEVVGPILQPESYGIALPEESPVREELNRALLELRENGTYQRLQSSYFED